MDTRQGEHVGSLALIWGLLGRKAQLPAPASGIDHPRSTVRLTPGVVTAVTTGEAFRISGHRADDRLPGMCTPPSRCEDARFAADSGTLEPVQPK